MFGAAWKISPAAQNRSRQVEHIYTIAAWLSTIHSREPDLLLIYTRILLKKDIHLNFYRPRK